jgi:hypothetical protein
MARSADEAAAYRQLFDRSDDYAELRKSWKEANRGLAQLGVPELARLQRKLQREFDACEGDRLLPERRRVSRPKRRGPI